LFKMVSTLLFLHFYYHIIIVTFTKVLTIHHKGIHPLHHSALSPLPWNSFNSFSITGFEFTFLLHLFLESSLRSFEPFIWHFNNFNSVNVGI
jgi:hypothetical protein